jgi:hypothetical protein
VPVEVRSDQKLAEGYEQMNLPPSLFPSKLGYGEKTPECDHFLGEVPEGEPIPWRAWTGPLLSWGSFLAFSWLMMIGLSVIVLHQWRQNERLPFPLLALQDSLVEEPEEGRFLAPLFRCRSFWIAAGIVFMLHFLSGMNTYYPEGVPAVPLNWNIGRIFRDSTLRHLPGHIKMARIFFIFLGVAYFMPNRIGFSIWFFELGYGLYVAFGTEYAPPFHYTTLYDHRVGGMFALTAFIMWVGRAHWARVFRCLRRVESEQDKRDRNAAIMFTVGCLGMFGWLWWVGIKPLWALFYVFIAFMTSILITRIVAETGMPFIRIDFRYRIGMIKLAPFSWLGPVSVFFSAVIATLFAFGSRTSQATMSTHALGLDREARPGFQSRYALLLVGVLILGLVISGAAHLHTNYTNRMSYEGSEPLNSFGTQRFTDRGHADLKEWMGGSFRPPSYNKVGHLCFGAILAGVLQWLCLSMPRWPLHPVGLIMNASFYANQAWASVLFGWLSKVLLVKYGGARMYRAAKPVFMGLIMGEVFAAVFWSIDPLVRVYFDLPHKVIEVLPK